jgi:hypothetical protein
MIVGFQSLHDEGAEATRHQLLTSYPALQMSSEQSIERMIEIWRGAVSRVYQHYRLSAKAYFTFLKLDAQVGVL